MTKRATILLSIAVACGESSQPTAPSKPYVPPARATAEICIEMTGQDIDEDGCVLYAHDSVTGHGVGWTNRTTPGKCAMIGPLENPISLGAVDIAPNCTPSEFTRYIDDWEYELGIFPVVLGDTITHTIRFQCETRPSPATGRFKLMVRADSAFPRAPLKVLADGEWLASLPMDSAKFSGYYDWGPYWSWWYEGEFMLEEGPRKIEFPELPDGYLVCNGNVCTNWYLPFIRFGKRTEYELFLEYTP